MCRKNVLTIAVVAVFAMAAMANAVLINVNIDTSAKTESTLDGPIFGNGGSDVGATWNQILEGPGGTGGSISGTDLKDSTNAATTVDFTSNAGSVNTWGAPALKLLTSAIFQWVPTSPYTLTISGLDGSEKYDLYLASFHPNELGNRALFSTSNTTTTVGTQIADSGGGGGNDSTWALGINFVVFEDVEPDGSNRIIITIVGDWTTDYSKRAYLNGFQIATAGASSTPPGPAINPNPVDGAIGLSSNTDLSWTAGVAASSSNVYFGTDPTPDSGEFKRNQTGTTYDPGTLAQDTYYWRIDSVNNDGTTTGDVWSFSVGPPGKAVGPGPYDTAEGISLNADLSWVKGEAAISSDVYFGTDPTPDSGEFKDNRPGSTYNLPTLSVGTTYYWRIDQVNSQGTTTGDVWSFTTMGPPVVGRNTFLVPVPATGASWKEFAYLAAVPASAAINSDGPSVIAQDGSMSAQVTEYLRLYNPANTYTIDTTGSLDEVACYLAETFWTTTSYVVLCDEGDYAGALAASGLAGRMKVPLMYFDSSTGLSSSALDVIENDLQCSTALIVKGNSTVTSQLGGIGVSQTLLSDDKAIITWMENNGYPVEYLAVCNTNDRTMSDYAPKGSLAAALLAAGRNGAVAALNYETEWNTPFVRSSTTTTKPDGLPSNTEPPRKYHDPLDLDYDLGSCTVNGQTYDWVVVRMTDGDRLDAAFIDFNDDGDFGDAGEYCPRTCELTINGKRYTFGVNSTLPHPYAYGEIRFSHPSDQELKEDMKGYHDEIGHYPKYMAIVGVLQVLPAAHALSYDRGWCDYVMNDNYFADVDDDPLYDIATGRIVGAGVTGVTLNASRCLTYNDLQYRPAADHVFHQCTKEFETGLYRDARQLENCGFIIDEWLYMADYDYKIYGVFIQDEHGWPFGIARDEFLENSSWTVGLAEGGGCNMASMDMYWPGYDWDDTNAVVLTGEGSVCFNAWVRGTGSGKTVSRDAFYKALSEGATTGEAHQYALNIMIGKDENKIRTYDLNANMFYGDPAVTLYKPTSQTYDPANVTVNGNTLTVHAPQTYWVDYIDSTSSYVYTAPGLVGFTSESVDGTFFATYTTDLQVTNMTQEGGVPSPLGWVTMREGQDYVIDEHWDSTRTIYWRVRLEQFNDSSGTFSQTINQIDYTIDYTVNQSLPGDLDLNGRVDLADFGAFAAHWLETGCDFDNSFCGGADINLIDDVDLDDLLILVGNWLEGASHLIARWGLDELDGTVAIDSMGGNDGTLSGDPTWRPSSGKIGGALEFDGVGDYVEVEGYKGISGSNPRTVTAWVRAESNGSSLSIVRWGALEINGALWSNVINAEGKLRVAVIGGSVVGDTVINDNTWHHVAIVLPDKDDVKVEDILLYVDGELEDTTVSSGDQTINTAVGMDVLISLDGSDGLLDDVRIYDYAVPEYLIAEMANLSLIAHWQFDESSGMVASDSMGGNDGTLNGDATWRPGDGKIGGALEFDGDGDYVEVAGYKGISGSNARTVTAWVKIEPGASSLSIVRWGTLAINGGLWSNVVNTDGKLRAAVVGGSVVGGTVIDDDTWHHVAIVLPDKEDVKVEDIRLYVDGEQEDTTISFGSQTIDTGVDMDVLISLDGSVGLLDDVRIYNYAISEDEIGSLADVL